MIAKIKQYPVLTLIICAVILYSPSFFVFFSNDDWFHLRVSQISTFGEFLNFFAITPTDQSTPFYRPLSTQLIFFTMQSIFELNVFFYRLLAFGVFSFILFLIYKLAIVLTKKKLIGIFSAGIYLFSSTNFSRLYYLSTIQELLMVVFVLLSLLCFLYKKYGLMFLFFVFGLLSKETAVVTPLLIGLIQFYQVEFKYQQFIKELFAKKIVFGSLGILLVFFLIVRFMFFSNAIDGTYEFDFSVKKLLNTTMWYTFWSFGVPEFLVDYVESGLKIVPKFFSDFYEKSYLILGASISVFISFAILFIQSIRKNYKLVLFAGLFWIFSLGPVLFLPWHKFTIQLTLPLVGFSIAIGTLLSSSRRLMIVCFAFFFVFLNVYGNFLYYERHYTLTRAVIAQRVFDYLEINYPVYPENKYFEFINDTEDYGKEFGSSQQIAHAISRSEMIRVMYKNRNLEVFYEDYKEASRPSNLKPIKLSTKEFLYQ
jgi:hypothetical protein